MKFLFSGAGRRRPGHEIRGRKSKQNGKLRNSHYLELNFYLFCFKSIQKKSEIIKLHLKTKIECADVEV